MAQFDAQVWPTCRAFGAPFRSVVLSFYRFVLDVVSGWGLGRLPPFVRQEIGDGHGLIAVGTVAAWPHAAAEDVAIRAALLAQVPGATGGAFIDRGGPPRAAWWWQDLD